ERMRQLVRNEELADDVAAGQQTREPDRHPARAERALREDQRLRVRIVESRALLLVQPLEPAAEIRAARHEAEPGVRRLRALDVARREALLDDGVYRGRDLLASERAGRNVRRERQR